MITIEQCPNPQVIIVHTNFDITRHPGLKIIIESIDGVEDSMTWGVHKYNFQVEFGKQFDRDEISKKLIAKVEEYISL